MSGKVIGIISVVVFILGAVAGAFGMHEYMDRKMKAAVDVAAQAEKASCAKTVAELEAAKKRQMFMEFHLRLGNIAIQAGRMNYGNARLEAASFFDDLAKFADANKGDKHEPELRKVLAKKDQIVSDLAAGNQASADALATFYVSLVEGATAQ